MKLDELERWFWDAVTGGDAPEPGAVLVGDHRLDAASRLGVYRDMYRARLLDALAEDFPLLQAAVGPERFSALGLEYVAAHPSTSPTIARLGFALPEFLGEGLLGDLARFERARARVFDEADDAALTLDDLRALPPEAWPELRLGRIRASERVEVGHAVEVAWAAYEAGEPVTAPEREGSLLVWRPDATTTILHRPLTELEADLIARCEAGEPFAALCEAVGTDDAAQVVAGLLVGWLQEGWLVARE